jgi:hypothetical protein
MRAHGFSAGLLLAGAVAAAQGAAGQAPIGDASGGRRLRDVASHDVPLASILDRAGRYVTRYSATFRNVVANETSRQWLGGRDWVPSSADMGIYGPEGAHQRIEMAALRSEVVWVAVPGSQPWGTFRDVVEVNGRKLEAHSGRLVGLFAVSGPEAASRARRIHEESARYGLGTRRNVDLPTLGLLWLAPENQSRLEFEHKGEPATAPPHVVEVGFREVARPTLVRDRGADVPSLGAFWIEPATGVVLRSEIRYAERGTVTTDYRREPRFDVLVPDVMRETGGFNGTARYAEYRRFGRERPD